MRLPLRSFYLCKAYAFEMSVIPATALFGRQRRI
jgi:hypothetical protein